MPTRHRPDFQRVFDPATQKDADDEDIFKWPHINLEDLLQAKPLLLLLNSRDRNPPHIFAHLDEKSFCLGRQYERISVKLVGLHTMFLAGQEVAESYGKIVPLKNQQQQYDFLTNHRIHTNPSAGLLVLEVQYKLFKFLIECCHLILKEIPHALLTDLSLPELPEPEPLLTTETAYHQLVQVAAEAPYRVPSKINTDRIKLLLEAKRVAAEDYLWDLREDPGVFASAMLECHTNCKESILDSMIKSTIGAIIDPVSDVKHQSQAAWNVVVWMLLSEGYGHLIKWTVLSQKAEQLNTLTGNNFDQFDRRKPLPKAVETTIIDMACILNLFAADIIGNLWMALSASTNLRASFRNLTSRTSQSHAQNTSAFTDAEDPLFRLFGLLCDKNQTIIKNIGLAIVVDEIQRTFDQDRAQQKRLSAFVHDRFSELALVSHIFEQLISILPWAANFPEMINVYKPKTSSDNPEGDAAAVHGGLVLNNLSPSILPLSEKLYYLIDRAYNRQNVEALQKAEANLDKFWKEADYTLMLFKGKSLEEILRRNSKQPHDLRRTPPWSPPSRPTDETSKTIEITSLENAFTAFELGVDKPGRFKAEPSKTKVKTRGTGSPQKEDKHESSQNDVSSNSSLGALPPPVFEVSARASKVFRTMFHSFGSNDIHAQREIDWKDFLHAMTAMGFAAEKLYGSVWHFTPTTKLGGKGMDKSIHFHEPHPSNKIPFLTARAFGRRFYRTYGWNGEMFTEREKATESES